MVALSLDSFSILLSEVVRVMLLAPFGFDVLEFKLRIDHLLK